MTDEQHRAELVYLQGIRDELARARAKFPRKFSSPHEAYAVLREELEEFWDVVKSGVIDEQPGEPATIRHCPAAQKELIQVAAMCLRALEDFA